MKSRAERATARTVETKALRVEASRDDAEELTLIVPGQEAPVVPTHWSYGQLCSLVGAPASYMRQLPAPLAGIAQTYDKQPYAIRRMLTEGAVKATDKRPLFVGLDAYAEAGGTILRDLFEQDHGGWLQDAGLLDMLVAEKLRDEEQAIGAEGWKWTEVAPDFAYGHTYGLRRLFGEQVALTDEEQTSRDALQAELDGLEETWSGSDEDLPEEVDARLGEIETAIAAVDDRTFVFDAAEVALAGAFVSIDSAGELRVDRGYVRAEDELPIAPEPGEEGDGEGAEATDQSGRQDADLAATSALPTGSGSLRLRQRTRCGRWTSSLTRCSTVGACER